MLMLYMFLFGLAAHRLWQMLCPDLIRATLGVKPLQKYLLAPAGQQQLINVSLSTLLTYPAMYLIASFVGWLLMPALLFVLAFLSLIACTQTRPMALSFAKMLPASAQKVVLMIAAQCSAKENAVHWIDPPFPPKDFPKIDEGDDNEHFELGDKVVQQ